MPAAVRPPAGKALTVRTAADAFLGSLGDPNTVRGCSIGVGETAGRIGEARPLAPVAGRAGRSVLRNCWTPAVRGAPVCSAGRKPLPLPLIDADMPVRVVIPEGG
ncbi:hypothetical protein GCM10010421_33540 [Streptomyces glaucus]|uniref:Uncharacterized protein n=1 Tax=Streptomyces glaucus TaxID=284029 RepID=A0ABP5X2Q3_9ACTN